MPTLRTGIVIAGGYADKVRRVLFAQLKDKIKSGEIDAKTVARAAGELNALLFEILVNKLQIEKGDAVRITVDYEVREGEVKWLLDTLRIEAWRRVPDEEIQARIKGVMEHAEEIMGEAPSYEVERIGEADTGDVVYVVKLDGRRAGALLVTPLNGKALVRAAFLEPSPRLVKRKVIDIKGSLDEAVRASVEGLVREAEDVERRHAERVYREILALVEAAGEEGGGEEE